MTNQNLDGGATERIQQILKENTRTVDPPPWTYSLDSKLNVFCLGVLALPLLVMAAGFVLAARKQLATGEVILFTLLSLAVSGAFYFLLIRFTHKHVVSFSLGDQLKSLSTLEKKIRGAEHQLAQLVKQYPQEAEAALSDLKDLSARQTSSLLGQIASVSDSFIGIGVLTLGTACALEVDRRLDLPPLPTMMVYILFLVVALIHNSVKTNTQSQIEGLKRAFKADPVMLFLDQLKLETAESSTQDDELTNWLNDQKKLMAEGYQYKAVANIKARFPDADVSY